MRPFTLTPADECKTMCFFENWGRATLMIAFEWHIRCIHFGSLDCCVHVLFCFVLWIVVWVFDFLCVILFFVNPFSSCFLLLVSVLSFWCYLPNLGHWNVFLVNSAPSTPPPEQKMPEPCVSLLPPVLASVLVRRAFDRCYRVFPYDRLSWLRAFYEYWLDRPSRKVDLQR